MTTQQVDPRQLDDGDHLLFQSRWLAVTAKAWVDDDGVTHVPTTIGTICFHGGPVEVLL